MITPAQHTCYPCIHIAYIMVAYILVYFIENYYYTQSTHHTHKTHLYTIYYYSFITFIQHINETFINFSFYLNPFADNATVLWWYMHSYEYIDCSIIQLQRRRVIRYDRQFAYVGCVFLYRYNIDIMLSVIVIEYDFLYHSVKVFECVHCGIQFIFLIQTQCIYKIPLCLALHCII